MGLIDLINEKVLEGKNRRFSELFVQILIFNFIIIFFVILSLPDYFTIYRDIGEYLYISKFHLIWVTPAIMFLLAWAKRYFKKSETISKFNPKKTQDALILTICFVVGLINLAFFMNYTYGFIGAIIYLFILALAFLPIYVNIYNRVIKKISYVYN